MFHRIKEGTRMQVESLSSHGLYDNSFSNDSETLRSPIFHNLMFMCIMIL